MEAARHFGITAVIPPIDSYLAFTLSQRCSCRLGRRRPCPATATPSPGRISHDDHSPGEFGLSSSTATPPPTDRQTDRQKDGRRDDRHGALVCFVPLPPCGLEVPEVALVHAVILRDVFRAVGFFSGLYKSGVFCQASGWHCCTVTRGMCLRPPPPPLLARRKDLVSERAAVATAMAEAKALGSSVLWSAPPILSLGGDEEGLFRRAERQIPAFSESPFSMFTQLFT